MTEERLIPNNIEAEEGILGGILLDPNAFARIPDELEPECFFLVAHQEIFRATKTLYLANKPHDLMGVGTYLSDHQLLKAVGGTTKLGRLLNRSVSAVNIDRYSLLVLEKYGRRCLIESGNSIVELGYDQTIEFEEALSNAESSLYAIAQNTVKSQPKRIDNVLVDVFNDLENHLGTDQIPGLELGFIDLDGLTQGISPSDLVIIAGRPAMGKTALCLNAALNVARKGIPVVIFSMEMSEKQLGRRLLSIESKVNSQKIRTGRISQLEQADIVEAVDVLSQLPIYIEDQVNITSAGMRSKLIQVQHSLGDKKIGLVIVDYLQLMAKTAEYRVQEISLISRSLKCLAREMDLPIIALSQLSRQVEQRNNKRPLLSDLRESGAIEQDADLVMMLYRDEYYNENSPFKGVAEVNIVKNRNGSVGTAKLKFIPELTKFVNLKIFNG